MSVGMGGIVDAAHYPAYQKAGFTVIGGYDLNPEQAQHIGQKYHVPHIYHSLDALIEASPENVVFDLAVPGKAIRDILRRLPDHAAVLIQKPMGETLDEAHEILRLCREKNLIAAVNFQMRYAPYIIAAQDMIQQGLIGEVNDVEVRVQVYTPWQLWSFLNEAPRLEILYHSIHYIDLLRSFLGNPLSVYAKTLRHPITPQLAPTRSSIILDYGDAVRATISTNHGHIYGTHKQVSQVKWEGAAGAIQVRAGVNMDYPRGLPDAFEYMLLHDGAAAQWDTLALEGSWFPDAFVGTMASVMRYAIGETRQLPTSVEDAFMTMAVVEAAYDSSANGGTPIPKR
jgi:predicted dehydrogenase